MSSPSATAYTAPGFDYANKVNVVLIAFYVVVFPVAVFLTFKHGLRRSTGWIYLILFSGIRIAAAAIPLSTMNDTKPDTGLVTTSAILNSVGLSPLFLITVALVARINQILKNKWHSMTVRRAGFLTSTTTHVALILALVGGIKSGNDLSSSGKYTPQSLSKVGVILFVVGYAGIVGMCVLLSNHLRNITAGERRLYYAIIVALPFLLVRLIYSVLSTFKGGNDFSILNGNVTVRLCMAYVEEMIVVLLIASAGLTIGKVDYDSVSQNSQGSDNYPLNKPYVPRSQV